MRAWANYQFIVVRFIALVPSRLLRNHLQVLLISLVMGSGANITRPESHSAFPASAAISMNRRSLFRISGSISLFNVVHPNSLSLSKTSDARMPLSLSNRLSNGSECSLILPASIASDHALYGFALKHFVNPAIVQNCQ